MIAAAVHGAAVQLFHRFDLQTVRCGGHLAAQPVQQVGSRCQPVALLNGKAVCSGDAGRCRTKCGKHCQNRHKVGNVCRIYGKSCRQPLFSIITHLADNFHNFFIALHTFRIQIGEGDVTAQCIRHAEERRL